MADDVYISQKLLFTGYSCMLQVGDYMSFYKFNENDNDDNFVTLILSNDEAALLKKILGKLDDSICEKHPIPIKHNETINVINHQKAGETNSSESNWIRQGGYMVNKKTGRKMNISTKEFDFEKTKEFLEFEKTLDRLQGMHRIKYLEWLYDEFLSPAQFKYFLKKYDLTYIREVNSVCWS